jgi:hypothetical protein
VAKLKIHNNIIDGTFLKGFWCRDVTGVYRWNYLPGACIKALKTFNYVPFRDGTLETSLRRNLASVGFVSSPLYRTLCSRFPYIGGKTESFSIFRESSHELDPSELQGFMVRRYTKYGTDLIDDLENHLASVRVGDKLHHPGWRVLAICDYDDGDLNGQGIFSKEECFPYNENGF